MNNSTLLSKLNRGPLEFKNRVFMAPMTRSRAPQQIPTDLMAQYYAQRASAGLIISEGSQVSPQGVGYVFTPGIHSTEQIKGWSKITSAVHQNGGLIFCQLWHVGRVSHPDFHQGELPVAPSAIPFKGQSFTLSGLKDVVTPRALTIDEIKSTVNDFKNAALAAKKAGFDGVEIHSANGYLLAQFLEDGSNQRNDQYGGTVENRARFILEVTDAVISVWGGDRVSVRLSPRNPFNGMSDSNPQETYLYLVKELEKRKIGILHFMEPAELPKEVKPLAPEVRKLFSGLLILNMGYTEESADTVISSGGADAVSFGTLFISNPDLPERFEKRASLASPDQATMYGGSEKGYTDYPKLGH
jgi:N-ethylmaleimide reductase